MSVWLFPEAPEDPSLHAALAQRDGAVWASRILHGQGWDWDSGVVASSDDKRNPDALRSDPHHAGLPSPTERLPDDDSMKPRRNAALQLLKLRLGI